MTKQYAHQILIADGEYQFVENKLAHNISSFRNTYSGFSYKLYENRDIRAFITRNFSKKILRVYDDLVPFAFKADLARYCLLYSLGGIYSDLSYLHINPILLPSRKNLAIFRDIPYVHPPWSVSCGVIYARPRSEHLRQVLVKIVENHSAQFYGESQLDVTGPYLLGRVLAEKNSYSDIYCGDSILSLQTAEGPKNICKYTPDGRLIAFRNKSKDSSLEEFISNGYNEYATLWRSRKVWR